MNRRHSISIVCALGLLVGTLGAYAPAANAVSWSSFQPAAFSGITLTPQLATGQLDYVLSLNVHPRITIGTSTYDVNWAQSYYVVAWDTETDFEATNGATVTDWTWETKSNPGHIAGWQGTGSNRLYPGQSKDLGFASFDISDGPVLSGLHVGYNVGGSEQTASYKAELPSVAVAPEPASLIALCTGLVGSLCVLRRRPRRG